MPTVQPFSAGGYRFISHQFQYSGGGSAEPGFRIERARFARPLPLAEGFDAIEAYFAGIGRSPTAFCACELRSPAQFTDAGFVLPSINAGFVTAMTRCTHQELDLAKRHAAATAVCHCAVASARNLRRVDREMRWR